MRKTAILIMIIVCGMAGAMEMLPGDGARVTVYGIEAEIVESPDGICDLSGAAVTGETEIRFEYYGDTLVRCVAGMRADWLRISNDTIWSIGADTRRENIRYGHGLPYLLPCRSAEAGDSVHHSVFMTIDRENHIASRYSSRRGCGFIMPDGDTIPTTYCVETEVSDSAATVLRRQWYAEGAVWPVVEQVTAKAGDEEYSAVNICPVSEQPRQRAAVRGINGRVRTSGGGGIYDMLAQLHGTDPHPAYPTDPTADQPYAYAIDPQGITVRGAGAEDATARLFDAAGRQWHEGPATTTIPTTHLPAGVYLLQISTPTATHTCKLMLNE